MAQVIYLDPRPRLKRLAKNLWALQMSDTPEAQAQMDKLVAELRANNYEIP